MKWINIKNEVFMFGLHVYLCEPKDTDEIQDIIKKAWATEPTRYVDESRFDWFTYYSDKDFWVYMFLHSLSIPTIAHEVVHVVMRLLEESWIPVRVENDEVFAYLVWFYMKKIIEWFGIKKIK